jgi:hypothetical protein
MTYPGAGIPNSTGSAWGTSYSTTGSGTVVALATSPSFTTPTLGAALATSIKFGSGTVLSTYEQGTWTPSVGGTATYIVNTGTYTKIGNLVTVNGVIYIALIGTGSTGRMSGLPFTVGSLNASGNISYFAAPATNSIWQVVSPDNSANTLSVYWLAAAAAVPNNAIGWFANGTLTYFTATYFT